MIRFLVFFAFLGLIVFIQRFWFLNAWRAIDGVTRAGARHALQGLWTLAAVLLLSSLLESFLGRIWPRGGIGSSLVAISRVWLVASFFAFFTFQTVKAVGWIAHTGGGAFSSQTSAVDPGRRDFFRYFAYLAGTMPFLAACYGFATGRLKYQIQKVEIPIAGLPKSLDGLRIVQLSDIHIGDFMPQEEVGRAVAMANQLQPDLAVVTGDFISGHNDPLEDCIHELSKLRAPLGTWGCNGNHEIYARAEDAAQQLFRRYGMRLLRQENVQLDWQGARFNLIGVDYQRDRMTPGPHGRTLEHIEQLVSRDMPNILLSHNPNSFHRAAELGIELSLAGHTHGGQVKFEIVDHAWSPARLITDFVAGLYRLPLGKRQEDGRNPASVKTAYLYVNRGLGTFGMPVRLGVPPEITLLTLRAS
ncbi:MAG TPA: metallophosphoesterase [Terriglobales bacterium]|nr:metallophosphoesterase [Terriglobales bacterium]